MVFTVAELKFSMHSTLVLAYLHKFKHLLVVNLLFSFGHLEVLSFLTIAHLVIHLSNDFAQLSL